MDDTQRNNLIMLAEYLDTGVTEYKFDMKYFFHKECGTVACAIGHLPFLLGHKAFPHGVYVSLRSSLQVFIYYGEYAKAFLGVEKREWEWLFSADWVWVDNTARGAAARIYKMLESGVPQDYKKLKLVREDGTEILFDLVEGKPYRIFDHSPAQLAYKIHPLPQITPAARPHLPAAPRVGEKLVTSR